MPKYEVRVLNRAGEPVGRRVQEAPDEQTALADFKADAMQLLLTRPRLNERVGITATTRDEMRAELDGFTWTVREVP